jgi:predicted dehydrogenase
VSIALYGDNGHQLPVAGDPAWPACAAVVAYAGFRPVREGAKTNGKESGTGTPSDALHRDSLDDILDDPEIDLVSLCSPLRADQARDAIRCMKAGKHVLAEKPCAMSEAELDTIMETARTTGMIFHEMAPTVVDEPYATMREIVASGQIGEVIQVYGQKSYPWFDGRPRDEDIDGGLLRQVGIYLYRFVEHIAGVRVEATQAYESTVGNHGDASDCRRAASVIMRLANGAVASGIANYATPSPPHWDRWGYETVRIFGVDGFIESINHGEVLRIVSSKGIVNLAEGAAAGDASARRPSFTELVLREVAGEIAPVLSLEHELHPTRMVNRAKAAITSKLSG